MLILNKASKTNKASKNKRILAINDISRLMLELSYPLFIIESDGAKARAAKRLNDMLDKLSKLNKEEQAKVSFFQKTFAQIIENCTSNSAQEKPYLYLYFDK